jgi:hypothetical protein
LFEGAAIMQEAAKTDHTWFHTMPLLRLDGLTVAPRHRLVRAEYRTDSHQRCAIKVLERHAPNAATGAWSDATACCYGEQLWRRCVARKSGVCALSGQTIAAGDAVYCPRLLQPPSRNIEAMILASVMGATPLANVV